MKKDFCINFAFYTLIALIGYIFLKFVLPIIFPVLLGFFIVIILKPIIDVTCKKTKISKKLVSFLVLTSFYTLVLSITLFAIFRFADNIAKVDFLAHIEKINFLDIKSSLPSYILEIADLFFKYIAEVVAFISKFIASKLSILAKTLPQFFINLILIILSSYFFSNEYENIKKQIFKLFKNAKLIRDIKNSILLVCFTMFKTYFTVFLVTFVLLSASFFILGIPKFIKVSFVISILDLVPAIGIGLFFIPIIIYNFILGNNILSINLLMIYILCIIFRNIVESKIISDKASVNPVLTIICMFLGAKIFGVLGMFFAPICLIIYKNMQKIGYFSV